MKPHFPSSSIAQHKVAGTLTSKPCSNPGTAQAPSCREVPPDLPQADGPPAGWPPPARPATPCCILSPASTPQPWRAPAPRKSQRWWSYGGESVASRCLSTDGHVSGVAGKNAGSTGRWGRWGSTFLGILSCTLLCSQLPFQTSPSLLWCRCFPHGRCCGRLCCRCHKPQRYRSSTGRWHCWGSCTGGAPGEWGPLDRGLGGRVRRSSCCMCTLSCPRWQLPWTLAQTCRSSRYM